MWSNVFHPHNIPRVCAAVFIGFIAVAVAKPGLAFGIGGALAFLAWMFSLLVILATQRRLYQHLKRHHYEKWAEITSGPFWGPGGQNSARGLSFLFASDDLEDAEVAQNKAQLRRALYWLPAALLTFITIVLAGGAVSFGGPAG